MHHKHNHFRRFAREGARPEGHSGHHHHRRGGGMRRLFAHGDLRLVILALVAERPRHGYDLIKAIEEQAGGAYSPSPGVVYPTLTMLEELGHVAVAADGAKKLYTLTPDGQAFLDENKEALETLRARLGDAGDGQGAGISPRIFRAMGNLKLALRLRLARGRLSEADIDAIAAAIDAAASQVEKI